MAIQGSNILSRGRNRRNLPGNNTPTGVNATATAGGTTLAVVSVMLDVPCTLTGVPQYQTTGANGALPVSAEMITPSQVDLTYAATQAASTLITIPAGDPALRTYTGGYVNPAQFDPTP